MGISLITGASSGIGRSLAVQMARDGEFVLAAARRKPLLDALVEEIAASGGRAMAMPCDVTVRTDVLATVARAESLIGPVDRLIACAGGGERTIAAEFKAAHFDHVMAINVGGTVHSIEAVLPGMLARGTGQLVAIGSLAAYGGLPEAAAYSAAKAALSNLMESLRIDLRPRGIDVTLICPGFVRTSAAAAANGRPFEVELDRATSLICRAIDRREPFFAFPWPLAAIARAARLLPAALYDRILSRNGASPPRSHLAERTGRAVL